MAALRWLVVALAWISGERWLANHGAAYLPRVVAEQLDLTTYLMLVQLVALAVGLSLVALVARDRARSLALRTPHPIAWLLVALAAPAVYVAAGYIGRLAAEPTLIEEIQRGGRALAQRSTGEFGKQVVHAPAFFTLLFTVIVAPCCEELEFRGALWALFEHAYRALLPAPASAAAPQVGDDLVVPVSDPLGWLRGGATACAAVGTTLVFTWLHADMPGGLGIQRWVSAAVLGTCLAIVRARGGSLLACVCLHVGFNLLGLATARRWLVTETFATHKSVPVLITALAALTTLALVLTLVVFYASRSKWSTAPRPTSSPSSDSAPS